MNIGSSFIPFTEGSMVLESFYLAIDLSLLFGLLSIYTFFAHKLGTKGVVSFVLAMAALASIVGPETEAFGLDLYLLGSAILVLGMASLSISLLLNEVLIASACCWIATLILAMSAAFFQDTYTVAAAGTLFGFGFILAGYELIRELRIAIIEPSATAEARSPENLN